MPDVTSLLGETDGIAVCDCGHTEFRVGLVMEELENHIRMLQCTACGLQLKVPFQQGRKG